jgi:DNA mismatch endonuclease (patch repair protein)
VTDVVDPATRSRMMSGIRGKDTAPERRLRSALHARGFRFRIHASNFPGRPDLLLPKWRAAIMVHGCFWHRHEKCRFATTPATRPEFWNAKFRSNVDRDARDVSELRRRGWRVAVVWECCLRPKGSANEIADQVAHWLRSDRSELELPSTPKALTRPASAPDA